MVYFGQLFISGIMVGAIYVLMAMSIVVIAKTTGIFNIAVAEITALGCFLSWALLVQFGLPLPLAIICLLAVCFLFALAVERLLMRPMIGQPIFSAVMLTIALMCIVSGFITFVWPGLVFLFPPIVPKGTLHLGEIVIANELLFNFIMCMLVFGILMAFFRYTKIGLAMRATSEDHQLAQSGGIRVTTMIAMAWFIAMIAATVAGTSLGMLRGANHPAVAGLALAAFTAAMVGGLESLGGVVIGGLLVGICQVLAAGYLDPYVAGGMAEVTPFVILLLVLIFRPYGLFGYVRIERV